MPSSMSCHRRLSYGVIAMRLLYTLPIGSTCKWIFIFFHFAEPLPRNQAVSMAHLAALVQWWEWGSQIAFESGWCDITYMIGPFWDAQRDGMSPYNFPCSLLLSLEWMSVCLFVCPSIHLFIDQSETAQLRLGLEPTVLIEIIYSVSGLSEAQILYVSAQKEFSKRHKVTAKKWIYLERYTFHRQMWSVSKG